MCLVSIAWQVHSEFPLIFVGNRDEFHARPSAETGWWDDQPDILGGRDLEAGGSWLGVSRQGRFAVVTNRPDLPPPPAGARSRGELIPAWLNSDDNEVMLDKLEKRNDSYGGFSLLLADNHDLWLVSGGHATGQLVRTKLSPGITGLSNTAPDDPWPKLDWLNQELEELLDTSSPSHPALLEPLLRDSPVPDRSGEDVSVLPFIVGQRYGTRSASVVTIDRKGECRFTEKRFGPGGTTTGESSFRFQIQT